MAGVKVKLTPQVLDWVRTKMLLENNVDTYVLERLKMWKTGKKIPTFHQIQEVSRKTHIPFGYFFLEVPPEEECEILKYRTVDRRGVREPSRNLRDVIDMMADIQEWMAEYQENSGQEPVPFVGCDQKEKDPDIIAGHIREDLKLKKDWMENYSQASEAFGLIRSQLEEKGILVMMSGIVGNQTRRKLNVEEFRAFTLIDPYAPLIFINGCDSENGKLFSVLHETAHIWRGNNSFYNEEPWYEEGIKETEVICNAVAAEILTPEEIFLKKWQECRTNTTDRAGILSKYFNCSQFVIIRRASDLGLISAEKYHELTKTMKQQYQRWRDDRKMEKNAGGNYYSTMKSRMDRRFILALDQSTREGRTQYTEAFRMTGTNRTTFERLVEEITGG
ncbi:MAG TPA: ImmA/IrrE family metallo-endopeptidase [Candidatus Anaerostipes avistercoris]|uniref:ImmA/IrrE family metallo-endopeptidase n=1 Tax=Candidatus Anaerostipes avistercoris TaxID=2838462 RepID=A0A9D2TA34_9FIRM|nr:ImmA/IrrE family metallo-endopeptidase [Candidatus Anaerostipes avistercoris]